MTQANPIEITIRKLSKPNCRPCAILAYGIASITDKLTEEHATVIEHDIVAEPEILAKYDTKKNPISEPPVLIFERNGQEITRLNGLVSADEIVDAVDYAKVTR